MKPELAQLRDFAQRYTAAWSSRDSASVAAHYSPNGSLRINDGPPAIGRKAIQEAAQAFMTALPDMQLLMDEIVTKGERTEFHWTLNGTNCGPGGTGHRVRISGFEIWKIGEDGLIAESQGHFDSAAYQRQLERGVGKFT
ncbi:MAG: ester cyclase [Candidatus Acidiferrales bacterium]